ncbi:TPM domain-containing protein [Mariniflexile aquimaris]|uniref:TPM domain-containing protein n=1 Tax=Mariniflexile aquimaris TaxID=881009 RepID=A0ABW3BUJ2_9FLAO
MPENYEAKPFTYLNDSNKIFTKEQNEELENLLIKLEKEGKKIVIITSSSKEKPNKQWSVDDNRFTNLTNRGIMITFDKTLKNIGIGIAMDTKNIFLESTRKKIIENIIIPEFENGNYYNGINKGIEEILKHWK